ncbi:ABC transporter permease [Sporomusa sp.]|uniref:ABC transporter permease n=1 Tax=Sporomusa sp. TaxID=2078658 RepID=UPI002C8F5E6E|nr:ABC transporter permease [Sporomusa sp.]HWR44119.1 ABC transporter permease [Sporomusa sp.]
MKTFVQKSWMIQSLVLFSAIIGALAVGAIFILLANSNPLTAYGVMISGPFSSSFGFSETMVRCTPLLLVGLGIIVSFRTGILNIGGEGQMLMGAVTAAAIALALPDIPTVLLLPLVLLGGAAAGGVWGGLAGWLKARLAVNEILSTVMLNQIAAQLYLFLIRIFLIDPQEVALGTGVPQTALLPHTLWLERIIPGTRLHSGFLLAVVLAILVYIFLWRTTVGYRMRAVGAGPDAARYAGIKVERYLVLAMLLGGAFAGLAGAVEVVGVHHRALEDISAGYGFSGIVAALFGRLHPLGVIPASVLFGALILGADMMQRAVAIPSAIVLIIQGLVILFIVSADIVLRKPEVVSNIFNKCSRKVVKEG